jgi:hypothetical protein
MERLYRYVAAAGVLSLAACDAPRILDRTDMRTRDAGDAAIVLREHTGYGGRQWSIINDARRRCRDDGSC